MKHNQTQPRQRIIESAFNLFHTQGYNSTGINQIIKEASVAKASLYQHFKSKEDLAIEYLNVRHGYWFRKLREFTVKENDPTERILRAFDFIGYMNENEKYRGCSFLNILSEIPADNFTILSVIQDHKNDLRNFFREMLGEDDYLISDHVYLLFESAITESKLFKNNWPVERAKEILTNILK